MKEKCRFFATTIFLVLLFLLTSCASVPAYDQTAYDRIVKLKVQTLSLINNATNDYSKYENDVAALNEQINIVYEYAKGRPHFSEMVKIIEIFKDPAGNLLGRFLVEWKNQGHLSEAFMNGMISNITKGFDQIIGLESGLSKT